MLNVEDMVNNVIPYELSVMAYVSSYYHAFAGAHKVETASNRICKEIYHNQKVKVQCMKCNKSYNRRYFISHICNEINIR